MTPPSRGAWRPEVERRLLQLVDEALERPADARDALLVERLSSETALLTRARELLAACVRAEEKEGPFATPASHYAAPVVLAVDGDDPAEQARTSAELRERLQVSLGTSYSLERELTGGGMSRVFVAEETALHRRVVVKVLPPEATAAMSAERFRRETAIAARLAHPHIVPLLSAGESDGLLFYTMPYIEGESLRARLARSGELTVDESVRVLRDIADALAYAHAQGVVHRDIKPDNILLSAGNLGGAGVAHAVVTDFGVARALSASTIARAHTATGVALGTPAYMAPEQAVADPHVDGRADLYALGVVAYELLAGSHPFAGRSMAALVAAHAVETPEHVTRRRASVPPALAALIMRLLEKRPGDRPQSASEVLRALEALPAVSGETTPEAGPRATAVTDASSRRDRGRRRRIYFAAGAALLILGALGTFARWRRDRSKELGAATPTLNAPAVTPGAEGERPVIAVLPLASLSADSSQEYFADGMTDELITQLAHGGQLRVISRSSVMRYKKTREPLRDIAQQLRADAVVEGSVRREGERVRITAKLLRGQSDEYVWAQSYDGQLRDVLALQDSIARAIADEIGVHLRPRALPVSRASIGNPNAYEAYLRGVYLYGQGELTASNAALEEAIRLDSTNAAAYAGIARNYFFLAFFSFVRPAEAFRRTKDAATRALALDETLADAHGTLALALLNQDLDWSGAEKHFRRALELDPSNANVHHDYAHFLLSAGREAESVAESERAERLNPYESGTVSCLGWHELASRQYDRGIQYAMRGQRLEPDFFWPYLVLGWAYEQKRMFPEAIASLRSAVRLSQGHALTTASLGHAMATAGQRHQAEEVLNELLARSRHEYIPAYEVATLYTALGDADHAFEWLGKARQERSSFLLYFNWDARLAALHLDPRFEQMQRALGPSPRAHKAAVASPTSE